MFLWVAWEPHSPRRKNGQGGPCVEAGCLGKPGIVNRSRERGVTIARELKVAPFLSPLRLLQMFPLHVHTCASNGLEVNAVNRIRLLAALGLASVIFTTAVAQDKKDPPKGPEVKKEEPKKEEPKKETQPADNPLTFKLAKDVPFFQELTTKTNQNIKVQGLDVGQNQEQTFYFKFVPQKQEGDKWVVQQTIEGVKMKIDIAGNPVSYDSTNEAAAAGSNTALTEFFKSLKGSQFTLILAKDMTVEKVEGREEFVKKLIQTNKQLEQLLNKILGEEAMKQMADPTFGVIPKEAKKVGDKWDRKVKLSLGPLGSYENTYTFTYKKQTGDVAEIDVAVALAYSLPTADPMGDALPFKIKKGEIKQVTEGGAKNGGTITFDTKNGRITASDISVKMTGTLTLDIAGTTTDVSLTQDQTTTVKMQDKTFVTEKK